jgi:hypothetical protein
LEGLRIENVGVFYGHLQYFTAIWNLLWPLGNVGVVWYVFASFGTLCQEKSGNPAGFPDLKLFLKHCLPFFSSSENSGRIRIQSVAPIFVERGDGRLQGCQIFRCMYMIPKPEKSTK